MDNLIYIIDFGSQYTQLIARRVRELNVYCEIHPCNNVHEIPKGVKGVILSGSPFSVHDEHAPDFDFNSLDANVPVLGLCYGAQLISQMNGGKVERSQTREYGRAHLNFVSASHRIAQNVSQNSQVWMSHGDTISVIPDEFEKVFSTNDVDIAGYKVENKEIYGIQFHPEVYHSTEGKEIIRNFVVDICGCIQNWTPDSFVDSTVADLKEKLGDDKVILGLSGGVDSTVAAVLIHKAIGKNLHCIFVNNGLLRKHEFEEVLERYEGLGLNVKGVDESQAFYEALKNQVDPEDKRKAIGKTFIEVFEKESKLVDNAKWLGQGTIYPDVIESISVKGPSATIKSHHNVGGLPEKMELKIVEPLRLLFKDEVRRVGKSLNISPEQLGRHPFPGPGLGIRILGEVTEEKVNVLQQVDYIFIESLKKEGLYNDVWQAGAILLPVQSVGVMGDERTYENAVALRAVSSTDGMTADWCHLPYDFLANVSNNIINKVKGINRVTYDISSKPPATIEWE